MVSTVANITGSSIIEQVIIKGDLSQLKPDERARYYTEVCTSIGVNPFTQPFQYITLNGKLTLYATKTATDQLRTVKGVSIFKVDAETVGDLRIVHAYARDASGREDMDIGAVNIKGLQGEALANAYMKALTKAKRRVTLSICGLGFLDESEIDSIPSARPIHVNVQTGEIIDSPGDAAVVAIESGEPMITAKQIAYIHVLKKQKGLTDGQIKTMHGQASAKLLTLQGAANFIGDLELLPDAEMAGAGTVPAPAYDAEYREVDEATGELLDSPNNYDPRAEQEVLDMAPNNPDRFTR